VTLLRRATGLAIAIGALALGATAEAQVYKWVDDQGVTHYGQRPAHEAPVPPKKLDIRVTGNDPAPLPGAICYTIQCQYERMRDDRLIRDEAWRKEVEARTKLISAQNEARAREAAVSAGPVITGVPVIVGRRVPYHLQQPHGVPHGIPHGVPGVHGVGAPVNPRAPQQPAEPQVRIRAR
jgi:hypothetical protein